MITVDGRELQISKEESVIGMMGDNKVEIRQFKITDSHLFELSFKLDINKLSKGIDIVDLDKTVRTDSIILTWQILEQHISEKMYIQLRGFDETGVKWHSKTALICAHSSVSATEYFSSPLPSEFEQMEYRVTQAKNETLTAADEVSENTGIVNTNTQSVLQSREIVENLSQEVAISTQQVSKDKNEITGYKNEVANNTQIVSAKADAVNSQAQSVAGNTEIVVDLAEQVSQDAQEVSDNTQTVAENMQTAIDKAQEALSYADAALTSEQNAKQSEINSAESESEAVSAMQTAVQAMQDLLSMMGKDIATLTGGKLTPSQIPAIAVTDTFVVNTEEAMLALVAQTGDVCIRNDESKSYILQGEDPTVLENWQHLQTPTDYASTAGYAEAAAEAVNATMINGNRMVSMTESEYANAVKDENTLYVVFPDW